MYVLYAAFLFWPSIFIRVVKIHRFIIYKEMSPLYHHKYNKRKLIKNHKVIKYKVYASSSADLRQHQLVVVTS